MTSTTYQVTGMTCEHCERAVTAELSAVPGVSAVEVTLVPGGESAVTVTSAAPIPTQTVADALDEAGGYHLASASASASAAASVSAGTGARAAAPSPRPTLPVI